MNNVPNPNKIKSGLILKKEDRKKAAQEEEEYNEHQRRLKKKKEMRIRGRKKIISDQYWRYIEAILGTGLVFIAVYALINMVKKLTR